MERYCDGGDEGDGAVGRFGMGAMGRFSSFGDNSSNFRWLVAAIEARSIEGDARLDIT